MVVNGDGQPVPSIKNNSFKYSHALSFGIRHETKYIHPMGGIIKQ